MVMQLAQVPESFRDTAAPHQAGKENLSTEEAFKAFLALAPALYPSESTHPYHNFNHAKDVLRAFNRISARAEMHGHTLPHYEASIAALGHDIHAGEDFRAQGFTSLEHLSATRTYQKLKELGLPEEPSRRIELAIRQTEVLFPICTVMGAGLRAADLSGLVLPSAYQKGSLALYREAMIQKGTEVALSEHMKRSLPYLALYLAPYIELTPYARGEVCHNRGWVSNFHAKALGSILPYWQKNLRAEDPKIHLVWDRELVTDVTPSSLILVPTAPQEGLDMLAGIKARNVSGIALAVPGDQKNLPLGDGQVDSIRLKEAEGDRLIESVRLLRTGGSLYVENDPDDAAQFLLSSFGCGFMRRQLGQGVEYFGVRKPVLDNLR